MGGGYFLTNVSLYEFEGIQSPHKAKNKVGKFLDVNSVPHQRDGLVCGSTWWLRRVFTQGPFQINAWPHESRVGTTSGLIMSLWPWTELCTNQRTEGLQRNHRNRKHRTLMRGNKSTICMTFISKRTTIPIVKCTNTWWHIKIHQDENLNNILLHRQPHQNVLNTILIANVYFLRQLGPL